jgi:UDPglucose--hexose-1-phosphate uridylyltransferase
VWTERTRALGARDDVAYVLIFENRDTELGEHAHSEIYGFREVPPVPLRELTAGQCTLCEPPPDHLVVVREGGFVAWCPSASVYPYEVRIAPLEHRFGFAALGEPERDDCAAVLAEVTERLERAFPESVPYTTWWHQRPTDRGEWPLAHLHAHINPRMSILGGAEMGSGVAFNPVTPEDAASRLRSV